MHRPGSAKLDIGSYQLHFKPSISQPTLKSATPSHEDLKPSQQKDIFAAKTLEEISHNYHEILLTYGKWNAETYLSVLNELNAKDEDEIHPLGISPLPDLRKMHCGQIPRTASHIRDVSSKYDEIRGDCRVNEINKQSGMSSAKLTSVPGDIHFPTEPSYKRIFKNAKLKRNPRRENDSLGEKLTVPPTNRPEKMKFIEISSEDGSAVHQEPCKLVEEDASNNYLLQMRRSRSDRDRKKVSFGSATEFYMDDIERYYKNTSIQKVLENNLEEQIQLMRATLKSHVTDVSGIDLLGDTGYSELRARCLNDPISIARFQSMLNDSRWRNKFELERIEDSDDANSLDVSDIPSSETGSVCSGDSLGSELDYKPKPIPPSRTPCIAEVREMGDILFDKIATKWERTVKKNFIDANMTPCFTNFRHALRLRSTAPVYSDIMKLVEQYDGLYTKAFTPHKCRMEGKLEKMDELQKAKDVLVRQRRSLESKQIGRSCPQGTSAWRSLDQQEPTKYLGQKQRRRLARIMRETKHRDKKGLTGWTKQTIVEDYVNLKPLIQTKHSHKNKGFTSEPTVQSIRPRSTKMKPNLQSLRSYEPSLYLPMPEISPPSSSPPSKNKLIAGSKSKLRMPI